MDYISRNHSKYLLMCHLIFVCKYRKKLLVRFEKEIKQIFLDIAEENNFGIIEMETIII
jgi:putative transposase